MFFEVVIINTINEKKYICKKTAIIILYKGVIRRNKYKLYAICKPISLINIGMHIEAAPTPSPTINLKNEK
jgi:hypothetical protein